MLQAWTDSNTTDMSVWKSICPWRSWWPCCPGSACSVEHRRAVLQLMSYSNSLKCSQHVAGDDSAGFEIIDGDDLDGMAEAEGAPAERQPGRRAATDQPLAVSLPTSLGLDPARLSAMRSSLFQSSRPLQVIIPFTDCSPSVMARYSHAQLQISS
jgi:hypothetical protein